MKKLLLFVMLFVSFNTYSQTCSPPKVNEVHVLTERTSIINFTVIRIKNTASPVNYYVVDITGDNFFSPDHATTYDSTVPNPFNFVSTAKMVLPAGNYTAKIYSYCDCDQWVVPVGHECTSENFTTITFKVR